jgi:hypothetical protein
VLRAHCTEDDLISLHDGELPVLKAWRARGHLRLCWRCSAQYHSIEETVRSAADLLARPGFPSEDRVHAARERLLRSLPAEHAPPPPRRRRPISLAAAVTVTLALLLPQAAIEDLPLVPAAHPIVQAVGTRQLEPFLARPDVDRQFRSFVSQPGTATKQERRETTTLVEAQRKLASGEIRWSAELDGEQRMIAGALHVRVAGYDRDFRWRDGRWTPEIRHEPAPPVARKPAKPRFSSIPLGDLQLQTHYALHRLGACLNEPIEVVNDGQRIVVSGLTQDSERFRQVASALSDLRDPRLVVRFTDSPTPASAKQLYRRRFVPQSPRVQTPPARSWLATAWNLSGQALIERENAILDASLAVMDEAWALRRLAQRFSNDALRALDPRSRWLFERMLTDHLESYEQRARTLASSLVAGETRTQSPPCPGTWDECAATLFAATETLHGHLLAGFSGGSRLWNSPGEAAQWRPDETIAALLEVPGMAGSVRLAWTREAPLGARKH